MPCPPLQYADVVRVEKILHLSLLIACEFFFKSCFSAILENFREHRIILWNDTNDLGYPVLCGVWIACSLYKFDARAFQSR